MIAAERMHATAAEECGAYSFSDQAADPRLLAGDKVNRLLTLDEDGRISTGTAWDSIQEKSAGDRQKAIMALYDEFRPKLFRYMRSMQVGRDEADEVIQETFTRLTAQLIQGVAIENAPGWIVRVAHNLAVDLLKKERGRAMAPDNAGHLIENRMDPAMTPEEAYSKKQQFRRMQEALSSLKPQHRQCFQMRAQGLRYQDIAAALGISEQRAAFVVKQAAVRLAAICG